MIFVTVGTERFPFDRLLDWVATILDNGNVRERVVIQSGACTTCVAGATTYTALSRQDFYNLAREARLVVSHCGEGSFFDLETLGKPFMLVPRFQKFGEHLDDHQQELAEALASIGIPIGWGRPDLERFIFDTPECPDTRPLGRPLVDHFIQKYDPTAKLSNLRN